MVDPSFPKWLQHWHEPGSGRPVSTFLIVGRHIMALRFSCGMMVVFAMTGGVGSMFAQATGPVQPNAVRVPPTATAVRTQVAPRVDGRLDENAWAGARQITTFLQRDPDEGQPASQPTEVRVLYDDEAIYIGARLEDEQTPFARLGRRDMALAPGDWLRVSFDSYHDRRSGFRFDVNPLGVRRDATLTSGTAGAIGEDLAWDPVWDAASTIDDGGWSVEMRIPFSQLRFSPAEVQTWGLQIERLSNIRQEVDVFSFTSRSEAGGVAAFGELEGLRGIRSSRPLELLPYALSRGQFVDPGSNPLREDQEYSIEAGLDARYRITSNLTLSATVNPDFGQVEVDPAVINLSAFETGLTERRPFFVEGASSFTFRGVATQTVGSVNLLNFRRIGRSPQLGLSGPSDIPTETDILAAAKISGKTGGWSLGVLEAVTGEERGLYLDSDSARRRAVVEPLTNYFVTRVSREMRQGRSVVGGLVTVVNRDLGDERVKQGLRSAAYATGLDFVQDWSNRMWNLNGSFTGTYVRGSTAAIAATQRSSVRYFQRPDAGHIEVDTTATSLQGLAGQLQLRKQSGLHWTGDAALLFVTPAYEANDLGFQTRADFIGGNGRLGYSERTPGKVFRTWTVAALPELAQNFDGDWVAKRLRGSLTMQTVRYWALSAGVGRDWDRVDDRLTRGGPLALRPAGWNVSVGIDSDSRRPITLGADFSLQRDRVGSQTRTFGAALAVRTSPRWNLTFTPTLTLTEADAQFVTSVASPEMTATYGARYIFAPLEQTQLNLVTRLNYTFTPNLSLELYAQPLVADGDFGTPKEFQTPGGYDFGVYGTDIGTAVLNDSTHRWRVDPDGTGPLSAFNVNDRSFTTRSLRGNAVLRWEYRPGSTFYVVWQQERVNPEIMNDFELNRAVSSLFEADSNNVLVLKWSYWFNP